MSTFKVGDRVKMSYIPDGYYDGEGSGTIVRALYCLPGGMQLVRWDAGSRSKPGESMEYPVDDLLPFPVKDDPRAKAGDRHVASHIYARDTKSLQAEAEYLATQNQPPRKIETTIDTRTSQLLNELYHDRARLERVVKDAAGLLQLAGDHMDSDPILNTSGDVMSETWLRGLIAQFVSANA